MFLNNVFLQGGVVSTSPNPQAGGPPLVGCPRLLIQFIRSYPPYRRPFLYPQPEDVPCCGDRDPLTQNIKIISYKTLSQSYISTFPLCLYTMSQGHLYLSNTVLCLQLSLCTCCTNRQPSRKITLCTLWLPWPNYRCYPENYNYLLQTGKNYTSSYILNLFSPKAGECIGMAV